MRYSGERKRFIAIGKWARPIMSVFMLVYPTYSIDHDSGWGSSKYSFVNFKSDELHIRLTLYRTYLKAEIEVKDGGITIRDITYNFDNMGDREQEILIHWISTTLFFDEEYMNKLLKRESNVGSGVTDVVIDV